MPFSYIVRRMFPRSPIGWSLPAGLLLLAGCLGREDLTDRSTGPAAKVSGPDCASCHAYPPKDTNHVYHLNEVGSLKKINGPVTCLDCHSTALAKRALVFSDTIYVDSLGNEWSSYDFPVEPGVPGFPDTLRTYAVLRVESILHDSPVPAPARPGEEALWQEYVTGLAHMNGKVDVAFHPRVTDTAKFPGLRAEFRPEQETCSAVACHPAIENGTPYWRFADPLRGMRELVGEPGDIP